MIDIPTIRARAEKATKPLPSHPGVFGWVRGMMEGYHHSVLSGIAGGIIFDAPRTDQGQRDCEFAAAARTDVPDLCDRVDELARINDALVEAGEWVLNVVNGVGRGGRPVDPNDDEPEAAFDALKGALPKEA